jgi:hypothetical protein
MRNSYALFVLTLIVSLEDYLLYTIKLKREKHCLVRRFLEL